MANIIYVYRNNGWIQPVGSGVAFLLLGFTLDRLQLKKRI